MTHFEHMNLISSHGKVNREEGAGTASYDIQTNPA